MMRDPFQANRWNLIAFIALILGGSLLLWIALRLAFSVTSRLTAPTPPL